MNILIRSWFRVCACALFTLSLAGCEFTSADLLGIPRVDANAHSQTRPDGKRNELIGRLETKARKAEFQKIVQLVEEMVNASSEPLWPEKDMNVGVAFHVPHELVDDSIASWQWELLGKECYLFRVENKFGVNGARDHLALVPTANVYEVIRLVGTNGNGFEYNRKELTTSDIIDWLNRLNERQPLQITGIGVDFIEGQYLTPVRNPEELAERIYTFSPNVVEQRTNTVAALADELRDGELCFWWE